MIVAQIGVVAILAIVAGALGGYAAVACAPAVPHATLVIQDVTVVDVERGSLREGLTVAISENRIAAIGRRVSTGPSAVVVDGSGRFLIPGLWDMHVHILQPGVLEITSRMLVANGVTGVRDMNGPMPLREIQMLRARVLAGDTLGPRFVSPGPLLDGPGRGPDAIGPMVRWVDTPENARDSVRSLARQGADFIKVYNRITPDLFDAIMDESRSVGIPVAGHVPLTVDPVVAAEAGQASMEHGYRLLEGASTEGEALRLATLALLDRRNSDPAPTPEQIERVLGGRRSVVDTYDRARAAELFAAFVRHGTWQCVTLVSDLMSHTVDFDESFERDARMRFVPASTQETWASTSYLSVFGDSTEAFFRRRWTLLLGAVGEMHRAGVGILAGSDQGAPYIYAGFSLHDELELLVEAGLSPLDALRTATLNPAQFLGVHDSLGTVEPGQIADLVLLEANPLEDIGSTRRIAGVVLNGRFLDRAELSTLLDEAESLARRLAYPNN